MSETDMHRYKGGQRNFVASAGKRGISEGSGARSHGCSPRERSGSTLSLNTNSTKLVGKNWMTSDWYGSMRTVGREGW